MKKGCALFLLPMLLMLGYSTAAAQANEGRSVMGAGGVDATNGEYHIAGTLGQPIIGAALTLHRTAWQGFWYSEPTVTASAPVPGNVPARLECSPNPVAARGRITMNVPEAGHVMLTLHDLLGRRVKVLGDQAFQAGEFSVELNTEDLPEGRYTVRCLHSLGENTLPILVVK